MLTTTVCAVSHATRLIFLLAHALPQPFLQKEAENGMRSFNEEEELALSKEAIAVTVPADFTDTASLAVSSSSS